MSGWAVDVQCPTERRDDIAAWMVRRTGHTVAEGEGDNLIGWAETETEAIALEARLAAVFGQDIHAKRRALDDVDWTIHWRDGIVSRRFGRLIVTPSWIEPEILVGDVVVVIDPESAFGTGEHGSTRVALALLTDLLHAGDRLLDLGSGSGILSIAAVKLGAAKAMGIEVDAEANVVAYRNAERNGVSDRVSFVDGDAAVLAPLAGPVDVIVANILRLINEGLLPEIYASLRPGGLVIFSGMELSEADLFRPVLVPAGFRVVRELVDAGWWGLAAERV